MPRQTSGSSRVVGKPPLCVGGGVTPQILSSWAASSPAQLEGFQIDHLITSSFNIRFLL